MALNVETIQILKDINKKVQVVWSIGKSKQNNISFFNDMKYKYFNETGLEEQNKGVWVWSE